MNNQDQSNSINALDILITIAKEKWFIFATVSIVTIIALVISLLWPVTYKSSSMVIPLQQQQSIGGGLGAIAGNLLPLSFDGQTLSPETLAIVLTSRSVKESIIEKFDLMDVYEHTFIEQTLRQLDSSTDIRLIREGGFGFNPISGIEISVIDREPDRAQAITAFYVSHLDSVAALLNEANTRERFGIIATRFEQNQRELERAEVRFKEFQEEYGIIDIESQSEMLIRSLADVVTQRTELDIEINLMEMRVESNNPELQNLRRTRNELDRVITRLSERGEVEAGFNFVPSLGDVPDLGLRYMRLYRDVVVQSKIYETIFPQFVQQQMLVESPRRNLQIVDVASYPTYKDGPKRAFIVLGGFFFSLIISLVIVFVRAYIRNAEEQDQRGYERISELKRQLFSWKKS